MRTPPPTLGAVGEHFLERHGELARPDAVESGSLLGGAPNDR